MFLCPACNAEISQLKNPKYLSYILYYNVRKKKARLKYKVISEDKVAQRLDEALISKMTFSPQLAAWSRQYIEELKVQELNEVIFKQRIVNDNNAEFEKKKTRLRNMLRDYHITNEEYGIDLADLQKQYSQSGSEKVVDWYSRMGEIVDLTECMSNVLANGTLQQKRNVLSKLGSNLVWNDVELTIHNDSAIEKLVEGIKRAQSISPEFEPKKCAVYKGLNEKTDEFSPVFSTMLRG